MPISYNYKKIFIHIPKCGGSSINEILNTNTYEELYSPILIKETSIFVEKRKFEFEEYIKCIYRTPQHLTYYQLEKIIPTDYFLNFSIFSVVRNPYDRIVSEYLYLMRMIDTDPTDIIIPKCTFEEFLENLKMDPLKRNAKFDGHLETQTDYLSERNGGISKNIKIYRFENLKECFDDLKKNIPFQTIPHLRKAADRLPYQEYYTEKTVKIVAEFYKNDFINFNYDINL